VTTDVAGRLLRLPFHNNLGEEAIDHVVSAFVSAVRSTG
jgi:dTDP-4-amino-4,6-dideoxygalactose transaminase